MASSSDSSLPSQALLLLLRRHLVDSPTISSFEWIPGSTPASSLPFALTAVSSYLSLTALLRFLLPSSPSLPPHLLRLLSSLHSLILLLLSALTSLASTLSASSQSPSPAWLLCFPPSTLPSGPLFFWAHVFYLSKIYEFGDTFLILLSGSRSPRLSFLHVYHHAAVVLVCYAWLAAPQSLLPVALVTNASVHVFMYAYYLSASLGWRWSARWKRAVTRLQIAQFVFSFLASAGFVWMHFWGGGCAGAGAWVFNALFNASLLFLFLDFHSAAYGKGKGKGKGKEKGV